VSADPTSDNAPATAFLRERLDALRRTGLARSLRHLRGMPGPTVRLNGREVLLLCSNNYLGLAGDERVKEAARRAVDSFGCGSTGSRLISGNLELYERLERELAAFKGAEAALVFTSGYQANVGTVSALAGPGDVIFSDALNHASLIDGSRLARAEIVVYGHCDAGDLETKLAKRTAARRRLILTESVFSMDGDLAPLVEINALAKQHGAMLMVDEAHATGVFGPNGAGRIEQLRLQGQVHIQMGTFSKALGSLGGYIAGSNDLIRFLLQQARSFVFTTGLPPAVLAASSEALRLVREEPQRRAALWRNVALLQEGLREREFPLGPAQSQILPVRCGEDRGTMAACRFLLRKGVFVQGIRPPTVPPGTSRLRIAASASHSEEQIGAALDAFSALRSVLRSRSKKFTRQDSGVLASIPSGT